MSKKTKKRWDKLNVDVDQYLCPMDEVDEEMYEYFRDIVCAQYCDPYFLQVGEAAKANESTDFHMTFARYDNKYYYLGELPAFKN